MQDGTIIALLGFLGAMIVVLAPVLKLKGQITELIVVSRELKDVVKDKTDNLDKRVTEHGKEIDAVRVKQAEHETRIKALEKN